MNENENVKPRSKKKPTELEKRIILYIEKFSKTELVQHAIKEIREKYGIPKNGLPEVWEPNGKAFDARIPHLRWGLNSLYTPKGIDHKIIDEFDLKIKGAFELENDTARAYLRYFLFHGKFPEYKPSSYWKLLDSKIKTEDLREEFSRQNGIEAYLTGSMKRMIRTMPIVIFLSPTVSKKSLIKYIDQNFQNIKETTLLKYPELLKDGVNKTKRRSSHVEQRNEFIANHPQLPRAEIKKIVEQKFKQSITLKYISVIRRRVKMERGNKK